MNAFNGQPIGSSGTLAVLRRLRPEIKVPRVHPRSEPCLCPLNADVLDRVKF